MRRNTVSFSPPELMGDSKFYDQISKMMGIICNGNGKMNKL